MSFSYIKGCLRYIGFMTEKLLWQGRMLRPSILLRGNGWADPRGNVTSRTCGWTNDWQSPTATLALLPCKWAQHTTAAQIYRLTTWRKYLSLSIWVDVARGIKTRVETGEAYGDDKCTQGEISGSPGDGYEVLGKVDQCSQVEIDMFQRCLLPPSSRHCIMTYAVRTSKTSVCLQRL
jgi:hypothetical protein